MSVRQRDAALALVIVVLYALYIGYEERIVTHPALAYLG